MGGESREGWLPWISRQFSPSVSPPPPPQAPIRQKGWEDFSAGMRGLGQNLLSAGESFLDDPYGTTLNAGLNWWKRNKTDLIDKGEKVLGTVGAVTTAPVAKMTGAFMDVIDPRNTGSEKKSMSDVAWEGAKAVYSGLKNPKAPQPTLTDEVGQRLPTEFGQGGDPVSKEILKFGINTLADPSNLIGEGAIKGGVGALAHLAGMGAHGVQEAMIPMWLAKQQKNIERFAHGSHSERDVESMIEHGFKSTLGTDILQRYAHAAPVSKKEIEAARKAGERVSHPTSANFGPYEMPVDFPANIQTLNLTEPVPKEDIELIVSKLHPQEDSQKIKRIWKAWRDQAQYVVDPADQISGKVPFVSVKEDPDALQKVRALEYELRYGQVHGIRGLGGESPLNHPDMPTSTNSPIGAIFYRDTAANREPESLAFDPRVASVTDLDETKPWSPLGMFRTVDEAGNVTTRPFPKDYVSEKALPIVTSPSKTPDYIAQQATGTKKIKPAVGLWNAAPPPQDWMASADTHIQDIKSILEEHDINPNLFNISEETKKTYSPALLHKKAAESLDKFGHSAAADSVRELWEYKLLQDSEAVDQAADFHSNIIESIGLTAQQKADKWHELAPEVQQAYKSKYPETYNQNVKKAPENPYADFLEAVAQGGDTARLAEHLHGLDPKIQEKFRLEHGPIHKLITKSDKWKELNAPVEDATIGDTDWGSIFGEGTLETAAANFHFNVGSKEGLPTSVIKEEWNKLSPEHQAAYAEKYPYTHGRLQKAFEESTAAVSDAEKTAHDFDKDYWSSSDYSYREAIQRFNTLSPEAQEAFKQIDPNSYDSIIKHSLYKKPGAPPTKIEDLKVEAPKTKSNATLSLEETFDKVFGPDSHNDLATKKKIWEDIGPDHHAVYKKHLPEKVAQLEAELTGKSPIGEDKELDDIFAEISKEGPIKVGDVESPTKTPTFLAREYEAHTANNPGLTAQQKNDVWNKLSPEAKAAWTEEFGPKTAPVSGETAIDTLKKNYPHLAEMFAGHSGTEMGSIESHTKDVLREWETQLTDKDFNDISDRFGMPIHHVLNTALPLHDIGKAAAIAAGDKAAQHTHTIPIMQDILKRENFTDKEINLATELFNHDLLGAAVQGKGKVDLKKAITEKANKVGMDPSDFAKLQMAVYQADAAAYPYITAFMKKEGNKWSFSGNKFLKGLEELIQAKK